jgi:hypothetical protein
MICRDNMGYTRDAEGVMIINGTSTAFLDAYLKGDKAALEFLKTADIDALTRDRATFNRK